MCETKDEEEKDEESEQTDETAESKQEEQEEEQKPAEKTPQSEKDANIVKARGNVLKHKRNYQYFCSYHLPVKEKEKHRFEIVGQLFSLKGTHETR